MDLKVISLTISIRRLVQLAWSARTDEILVLWWVFIHSVLDDTIRPN